MATPYLASIQECRQWLSYKGLDEFIYLLLDNGYDDLEVISHTSDQEMKDLENLFKDPEHKTSIRVLVQAIRTVGIEPYRSKTDKTGITEFKRLIAANSSAPAPAAVPTPAPAAAAVVTPAAAKVAVSGFARPSVSSSANGPPPAIPRRPTVSPNAASTAAPPAVATPTAASAAAAPATPTPAPATPSASPAPTAAATTTAAPAPLPAAASSSASASAPLSLNVSTTSSNASSSNKAPSPASPTTPVGAKRTFGSAKPMRCGYLCVRSARGEYKSDAKAEKWADKWSLLEPPIFRYLTTRKDNATDQSFPITGTTSVKPVDAQTIRLQFADRWVELWSSSSGDITEWAAAVESVRDDLKAGGSGAVTLPASAAAPAPLGSPAAAAAPSARLSTKPVAVTVAAASPSVRSIDEEMETQNTPPSPSPSQSSLLAATPSPGGSSELREMGADNDSSEDDDDTMPPPLPTPTDAASPTSTTDPAATPTAAGGSPGVGAKKLAPSGTAAGTAPKAESKGAPKAETKSRRKASDSDSDGDDGSGSDDDDAKSRDTWDRVLKAQAAKTARMSLALGPGPSSPVGGAARAQSHNGVISPHASALATAAAAGVGSPKAETPSELRFKQFSGTLLVGNLFKKFKRGNMSKRQIWVTPNFDFLCWGDDERNVKGYMLTSTIEEINQGFGRNITRIYVVSAGRTLELEAKTAEIAKEWVGAIEFLIQFTKVQEEKKRNIVSKPGYKEKLEEVKQESTKLLLEGDTFKKWPGRKKIKTGAFTVRRIWADPIDCLNWGEAASTKVKGTILLQDMVQILEDDTDKLKFTIFSKGRSLDLEAKSAWVRERWAKALRFWIEYNKTQPRKKSVKGKGDD